MTIDELEISARIDSKGMSCPIPIVKTAQAMATLQTGQLLEVVAYQPKSVAEFTAWGKSTRNSLVESSVEDGVYRFVFRKK
jgi:tRNA 2-thiouridine synthesizing protein A